MSGKQKSRQRVESFINEIEQGTARLTDEKFARLERISGREEAALRHIWLLRRLIQPNPATPDRVVKQYRSMYVFVKMKTTRAG